MRSNGNGKVTQSCIRLWYSGLVLQEKKPSFPSSVVDHFSFLDSFLIDKQPLQT